MHKQLQAAIDDVAARGTTRAKCNWCSAPAVRRKMYCEDCQFKRDAQLEADLRHDESMAAVWGVIAADASADDTEE